MLENKQTEGKPSKKLAKPRALASIIIALVVIVAGGAYYAIQAFADDAPPKLTSDAKYQGLIKDGQYDFAAWETADKNKFEENKEDAEDESWNVIDIRSTSQGANYLYAEEDLTFYDVITRIDPKGESIVVARYNPKSSKFDIYPQTNYYNRNLTNVVDPKDEDEATIQAGEGFMVVSTKSSKGYGLYHGDDMNEITESPACKLSKGWNLVASHTEDLKALVAHCYEDVDTIWVETDPTAFDKKFKKGSNTASELTDLTRALVWIKFADDPSIKDPTPDAVDDLTAVGAEGKVTLNWTTPDSGVEGVEISSYKIRLSEAGGTEYREVPILASDVSPSTTGFVIANLDTSITEYDFSIMTTNELEYSSAYSEKATAAPGVSTDPEPTPDPNLDSPHFGEM